MTLPRAWLPAFVFVAWAGCFNSLDFGTIVCHPDKPSSCPRDYVCLSQGGQFTCHKSVSPADGDARLGSDGLDGLGPTDGVAETSRAELGSGTDGAGGTRFDGDEAPGDGPSDHPIERLGDSGLDVPLDTGGSSGTGGSAADALSGTGGAAGSGGTAATGGHPGFGGTGVDAPLSGGAGSGGGGAGSGGLRGTGGIVGAGGIGSGGVTGTGGAGTGGAIGSGGAGTGGVIGTGGVGTGGVIGTGGSPGSGGTVSVTGPCDIYAGGSCPCIAAHSTVRALFGSYTGKLYQVQRSADGATLDIGLLSKGGLADSSAQDAFCGASCVINVIYDQSGHGNDMWYQGSAAVPGSSSSRPANASSESLSVNGHAVYSLYISPGNCYWHDGSRSSMATGAQPEGMYMVTSSQHVNSGCCFDYGNSETDRSADGAGAVDAINFSSITAWGTGAGTGPWVMADLEFGIFTQGTSGKNSSDPTQTAPFVTAVLKNDGRNEFALRGGDATSGVLGTYYKGALPPGWSPMKKQGAIVLGCSGDCCKPSGGANASAGTFYEGAIVSGYPSDATEDAVQVNIVAARYGTASPAAARSASSVQLQTTVIERP